MLFSVQTSASRPKRQPSIRSRRVQREEPQMALMAIHKVPSLTRERYEEVVRRLTNGKSRFESPDDVPFEGLLIHVAAETDDGFVIFDVFESQEAFERFGEKIAPIPREVGIEEPPKAFPVHTFIADLRAR